MDKGGWMGLVILDPNPGLGQNHKVILVAKAL